MGEIISSKAKWIGEVPSSWNILQPRRLFTLRREPEREDDIQLTPSQKYGVLPQTKYMEVTGSRVVLNLTGNTMQHVEPGDFISHLRTFQGGLELARQAGKVSPAYTVVTPRPGVNPEFFKYVLKSGGYISQIASVTDQLRDGQSMRFPEFNQTWLPLPPTLEQQQIADYLDHETAEIDAFIADQQDLSKLFQERWQSYLVRQIQTGGQSVAQLLSTEVAEWPHAPSGWEAMRLKSTIIDSQNGSWGSEPGLDSVTRRCIRVADFNKNSGRIHSANETERSYSLSQVKNLELQPGDLIIEKSGGGPTTPVGNVVLYDAPGGDMFSNFVARIRLRSNICPLFAVYLHRSLYLNQITQRSIKQTTGIQNLDAGSYFNETIFLPPFEEQKNIGLSIEENRIETEASLQVIEKTIDLALERRAALITAAVTGQIDVTAKNKPAAEQLEDDLAQGLHREHA